MDDPTSIDAASLITEMDTALKTADVTALTKFWEYIKARQSRLRIDLKSEERTQLEEFLKAKWVERVFVLSLGSLESYLPAGHAGKDLEKLIELVSEPDWWDALPADGKVELQRICEAIPF